MRSQLCRTTAFDYTLRRWDALERYAQTGCLPIDNNPVENSIRPIAIGKKNCLFMGSERAGKRAAAIQSLIGVMYRLHAFEWLGSTSVVKRRLGKTTDVPK